MKVRSFILVCCMVIVPALAMFSQHLPVARVRNMLTRTSNPTAPDASREPARSGESSPGAPAATAVAGSAVAPAAEVSRGGGAAGPPLDAGVVRQPRPAPPVDADTVTRAARDRLVALGATGIECQPAGGAGGSVLCSCRVAVDASGQLQRLFQAAATDPATGLAALADDVTAWRHGSIGP